MPSAFDRRFGRPLGPGYFSIECRRQFFFFLRLLLGCRHDPQEMTHLSQHSALLEGPFLNFLCEMADLPLVVRRLAWVTGRRRGRKGSNEAREFFKPFPRAVVFFLFPSPSTLAMQATRSLLASFSVHVCWTQSVCLCLLIRDTFTL